MFMTPDFVGNCDGLDVEIFFPAREADERAVADRYCASCPVQVECLEYAFSFEAKGNFQVRGVYGNTTEAERREIRRQRKADAA